jgi:hypothetical protein
MCAYQIGEHLHLTFEWDLLWRKPKIGIWLLTVQVEMVGKC